MSETSAGDRSRTLYFFSGSGMRKAGCRLEDGEGRTVYEAVRAKRSLTADQSFEFIDTESGRREIRRVGRTKTRKVLTGTGSADGSGKREFVIRSTFACDGTDIWDHLHGQGIRIRTEIDGLRVIYRILRGGAEIGAAETAVRKRGGLRYTVSTREEDLDALFLTLFAIQRTDAVIYE